MRTPPSLRLLIWVATLVAACSGPDEPALAQMTTPELLARGEALSRSGETAGAIAAYRMVIHRDSLNAEALGGLAAAYRVQGRTLAADRYERRAVYLTYASGLASLEQGDSAAATAAFDRTLKLLPRHPLALLRLGDMAHSRGDLSGAIDLYRRAAGANPDYAESYVKLGDACTEAGEMDEARDAYDSAIGVNVNAYDAYMGLGRLDGLAGQWAAAAEHYRKALLIKPDSSPAQEGLSRARQNL